MSAVRTLPSVCFWLAQVHLDLYFASSLDVIKFWLSQDRASWYILVFL